MNFTFVIFKALIYILQLLNPSLNPSSFTFMRKLPINNFFFSYLLYIIKSSISFSMSFLTFILPSLFHSLSVKSVALFKRLGCFFQLSSHYFIIIHFLILYSYFSFHHHVKLGLNISYSVFGFTSLVLIVVVYDVESYTSLSSPASFLSLQTVRKLLLLVLRYGFAVWRGTGGSPLIPP